MLVFHRASSRFQSRFATRWRRPPDRRAPQRPARRSASSARRAAVERPRVAACSTSSKSSPTSAKAGGNLDRRGRTSAAPCRPASAPSSAAPAAPPTTTAPATADANARPPGPARLRSSSGRRGRARHGIERRHGHQAGSWNPPRLAGSRLATNCSILCFSRTSKSASAAASGAAELAGRFGGVLAAPHLLVVGVGHGYGNADARRGA